jgi:PAS domain S-box-containing protein
MNIPEITSTDIEQAAARVSRRTAFIYLAVAAIWILLSDSVLALLVSPETQPARFAQAQTIKGWLFVSVTALLFYLLLQRQLSRLFRETAVRRQTQTEMQALLSAMPLAVIQMDRDSNVQYWNKPAEAMFGWTEAEIAGQPIPYVPPDKQSEFNALLHKILNGESFIDHETVRQAKSGRLLAVTISSAPVRLRDGSITGMVTVINDITIRKQAQAALEQLNRELEVRVAERTAQLEAKNRELEAFAYSVSHDLKAPLRGIDGYGHLLQEDYADRLDEEGQTFINNIRQATAQMARLIDDLLAYSRLERQSLRHVPISLSMLIESLLREQQEAIAGQNAQIIQTDLDQTITVDPDGLAIILRNLLANALKFTKEGEPPVIEIGCKTADDTHLLWVKDGGIGFDMQFQPRIFEIFQRLHHAEQYPGTGIGLALVRKAAERLGGTVWAESKPGEGATFYIQLPASHTA